MAVLDESIAREVGRIFKIEVHGTMFLIFLMVRMGKLGKIEAGFYTLDKIRKYDAVIISIPKNVSLEPKEIEVLEEYVRTGGNLLIIGSRGGEYLNRTNINELTRKFGFEFATDEVNDSVNYVNLQKRQLLTNFKPHYITENIKRSDTHSVFSPIDLNFSGLSSFQAGWKFHLYCDIKREEIPRWQYSKPFCYQKRFFPTILD